MVRVPKSPIDDLKMIKGIGPVIEQRLRNAGIRTFSGLATLSAEEIASLIPTISVQQIKKQGWIPQAHKLASGKSKLKPRQKEQTIHRGRQHYENFTFEFLLDEKNKARLMRVVHIQSGDVDTWANWDAERLIDFIARHIGSHLPTVPDPNKLLMTSDQLGLTELFANAPIEKTTTSPMSVSKETFDPTSLSASVSASQIPPAVDHTTSKIVHEHGSSPDLNSSSINKIRLLEWKLLVGNTDRPWSNIPQNQLFDTSLTLDLNNVRLPDGSFLEISETLYVKELGHGQRQILCDTHAIVPYTKILNLTIDKAKLSAGNYHLEALVALKLIGIEAKLQPNIMAFLELGIIQVY